MVQEQAFEVFLSYHWQDRTTVEVIARSLQQRGMRPFLDRWYLSPGQVTALQNILGGCGAVLVFVGSQGVGRWQQREVQLALDRQTREPSLPVIPVLLTGADPALGFLSLNTWVDLRGGTTEEALAVLTAAICSEPPGPDVAERIRATRAAICPYRGLRLFREEDAAFFCGREAFTDSLEQVVSRRSMVGVVGASGSGKSSVARAGLLPRLRRTGTGQPVWDVVTMVPGDRPLHSLAAAVIPLLKPELDIIDQRNEGNKLAEYWIAGTTRVSDTVADALRLQSGTERLLLLVDQWEELYTLCNDEAQRRRFIDEILEASERQPLSAVLTLRGPSAGLNRIAIHRCCYRRAGRSPRVRTFSKGGKSTSVMI